MSDIYDYVRVCLFEKFPTNTSLSGEYIDRLELNEIFLRIFRKALMPFEIDDKIPLEEYSLRILEELEDAGLIKIVSDPLAGNFYWADLPVIARYMAESLQKNEIYHRKAMLKGDRLYEAVFASLNYRDYGFGDDEVGTSTLPSSSALPSLKTNISESERAEFRSFLRPMRDEIEAADLSQEEKADALAAVAAVDSLSDAPNPLWQAIYMILSSPILSNVTALAALAISILQA